MNAKQTNVRADHFCPFEPYALIEMIYYRSHLNCQPIRRTQPNQVVLVKYGQSIFDSDLICPICLPNGFLFYAIDE